MSELHLQEGATSYLSNILSTFQACKLLLITSVAWSLCSDPGCYSSHCLGVLSPESLEGEKLHISAPQPSPPPRLPTP